jgi:uncharacterized protein with ParB-like and HNH nuclease domain
MTEMKFENQTLDTIFKKSTNLAIPTYQRGYAWTQEQWEDFWEDLSEVVNEKEDDHFFGQVVTNTQDGKEYIVDGQQRVTTSVIFLAVLRDHFRLLDNAMTSNKPGVRAEDIQDELIGNSSSYHLTQSELSQNFFRDLIQKPGHFETTKSQAHTNTDKNFVKAYEYLYARVTANVRKFNVSEERLSYLESIKKAFLDHVFVMKISTSDEASAFVIFETLNARGRDLNSSDLLKNHLFRKAKGSDEIQSMWNEMMEPLEYDSVRATRFIRAYWNGTHDFVTEKKLYRELNHGIQTQADATEFVARLADLSDDFASMADTKSESIFQNPQLVKNLRNLSLLSAKTFYPLILVMISKGFPETDLVFVTHKIISFTIRNFTIGGLVANQYEKMFSNIARALYRDEIGTVEEINAKIATNMISDDQFSDALKNAVIKTEKAAKYVLYELAYADEQSKINLEDVKVIKIDENIENSDRIGNKLLITKLEAKKAKKGKAAKLRVVEDAKFQETSRYVTLLGNITDDQVMHRQASWLTTAVQTWSK